LGRARGKALTRLGWDRGFKRRLWEWLPILGDVWFRRRYYDKMTGPCRFHVGRCDAHGGMHGEVVTGALISHRATHERAE
jgi:hypothetical protein